MENITDLQKSHFKTTEEEREYWEAHGPLAKGARGKINRPVSKENRSSFLSVRLSGKEITQLRDLALKCDRGPSTLARDILVAVLSYRSKPHESQQPQTMQLEDLCRSLTDKMPESYKERLVSLIKSSMIGDADKPSLWIMDASQIKELNELSAKIMTLFVEVINPNIRIVTPFDKKYEQVKSALDTKEEKDGLVKA